MKPIYKKPKLSFISHKEQCHCSRTGVGADGGSYLVHNDGVDLVFLFYFLCYVVGFVFAVAVADEDGVAGVVVAAYLLIHEFYQFLKGFLTAANFTNGSEFSIIVHMEDRFDVQHASYHCSSSGNAAAAVQMI